MTMDNMRGPTYRLIRWRDRRHHMAWGYPLLRLPRWGLEVLSSNNSGGINLISRHPRWSITWLWFIEFGRGRRFKNWPWVSASWPSRKMPGQQPYYLFFFRWHIGLHTQNAMPYGPSRQHYSRRHYLKYADRFARRQASAAGDAAYRSAMARMMDGRPDDDDD